MIRQIQNALTWLIASWFSIFKYINEAHGGYMQIKGNTNLTFTWTIKSSYMGNLHCNPRHVIRKICLKRKSNANGWMQSDRFLSNIIKSTCRACNCIASVSSSSFECLHWIIFQIDEIVIFIYFVNRPSVFIFIGVFISFLWLIYTMLWEIYDISLSFT